MEEEMGFEDYCNKKKEKKKWEGKVSVKLKTPTADEVFQLLLHDFFNLHKWFPTLTTCYGIHGLPGQPGCIRYCAGSRISSVDGSKSSNGGGAAVSGGDKNDEVLDDEQKEQVVVNWCTERLLGFDSVQRSFSYEIVDGNIGFNSYVSTMKVLMMPEEDGTGNGSGGCVIQWSFELDPMHGWEREDLVSKYQSGLQNMAHRIEDHFSMAR